MKSQLLRVTQLDAIQLDNEIVRILKQSFESAVKYLQPGFAVPLEHEINLLLRLLIINYSVLKNNATFGQKLLLIKYGNLTNTKKILYIFLSSLEYIRDRFNLSSAESKYYSYVNSGEFLIKIFHFINLSIFLSTGKKPNLIDRVLNLEQVYVKEKIPRRFGNKYLTRELLWNGFIEFLVFALPLINYHKLKRLFKNLTTFDEKSYIGKSETRIYSLYSRCPHCLEVPIHPHHMGCAHVFCYVCLKSNQMADPKYECPLCGYSDVICERVAVYK